MEFDKSKICFIAAAIKGDYCFDGINKLGYQIMIPYRDTNLLMRCLREAWFRLKLPAKNLWYNPHCAKVEADTIIVRDSLIIPDYLLWLRKKHPQARIILDYDNMVNMMHGTIQPGDVTDPSIEKWTYDEGDSKRYGMNMKCGGYYDGWKCTKTIPPYYDVVYVGRDKGRAEKMFELEKQLKKLGLNTCFYICADRRFLTWTKPFYRPLLPYADYLDLIGNTKATLNIVQEGAVSITMREVEAVFHNVKCITNNPHILQFQLYHPSRYFYLDKETINQLPDFLEMPFEPVPEESLNMLRFDYGVKDMILNNTEKKTS